MPNYDIQKRGYVLPAVEEFISSIPNRMGDLFYQYFRVVCEPGACEECQQKSGSLVKVSDAKVGVNYPPFHPNCKCSIEELSPAQAEYDLWTRLARPDLSAKEKVRSLREFYNIPNISNQMIQAIPLPPPMDQRLRGLIRIPEFSDQFLRRVIHAATRIENFVTPTPDEMVQRFSTIMEHAPTPISEEADLPGEEVNFDLYRHEDFRGITLFQPGTMQQMAYTDSYGFRRISINGLSEDAYMAAFPEFYIKDDDPKFQNNTYKGKNPFGIIYRVYLSNGESHFIVAGDTKPDTITNSETHQYSYKREEGVDETNSDIIEFILDEAAVSNAMRDNNYDNTPWDGIIISMERLPFTVLDY